MMASTFSGFFFFFFFLMGIAALNPSYGTPDNSNSTTGNA